jgi:hypothetical protein
VCGDGSTVLETVLVVTNRQTVTLSGCTASRRVQVQPVPYYSSAGAGSSSLLRLASVVVIAGGTVQASSIRHIAAAMTGSS